MLRFVTSNKSKAEELGEKLAPLGYSVMQVDLGYPEIQTDCLEKVVEYGLEDLRKRREDDIIIEDSGLFIDALGGFPGIYSADVFKTLGNRGVLKLMEGESNRHARFRTVIGVLMDGQKLFAHGSCQGSIASLPRGEGGFGYDPIFIPDGQTGGGQEGVGRTFGEMSGEEKNEYSHRARAAEKLLDILAAMK
ncbi:MAG: RdgB/HAM1 family non-canonical purine NTP pyrophosphatase [Candidatus Thermoplasmatota archaeon]|nr:RdgB/HAM1 family non-canonical purine NTP pyrophosphatase [Candidatus Thermoplasmatota archaeon]